MAVYEALLLNTVVPQIQAAQAGDSYVMVVNATTPALRITQTGTGNALEVEDSANPDSTPFVVTAAGDVGIGTSSPARKLDVRVTGTGSVANFQSNAGPNISFTGTESSGRTYLVGEGLVTAGNFSIYDNNASAERVILDASGNLGLGVTPDAWSAIVAFQVGNGASLHGFGVNEATLSGNVYYNSGYKYAASSFATQYQQQDGAHKWYTAPSGTAGNAITFTQAMTLDASGNLGVGTTSPTQRLSVSNTSGNAYISITAGNTGVSGVLFADTDDENIGILAYDHSSNAMTFRTNDTERARITSGGYFKASNTGTYQDSAASYHELRSSTNDSEILYASHTSASVPIGISLKYTAASPNGTGSSFLYCSDSTATRADIRSNGGIANYQANDVNLSDARLKTDITPVSSYWDKIKSLEIVSFKYKDQTDDIANIGVIAQQVESVAPEFVSNDGFGKDQEGEAPYKTIYTTDMYHAAIKALQEAMARIETLEAKIAALEAK
jgi:hypothetical protein